MKSQSLIFSGAWFLDYEPKSKICEILKFHIFKGLGSRIVSPKLEKSQSPKFPGAEFFVTSPMTFTFCDKFCYLDSQTQDHMVPIAELDPVAGSIKI